VFNVISNQLVIVILQKLFDGCLVCNAHTSCFKLSYTLFKGYKPVSSDSLSILYKIVLESDNVMFVYLCLFVLFLFISVCYRQGE